jgi:catechol 2,3-dioxygenase-like lactoylglutathione lyase family enzyme
MAVQIVPVMKCRDLERSIAFYTEVLGFQWRWPEYKEQEIANGVADLALDDAAVQLSRHAGDGCFGALSRVFVEDVDTCYRQFCAQGLDVNGRPDSPVHTAPVDQTWGLREFAVTDPDGNGLLFCAPVR